MLARRREKNNNSRMASRGQTSPSQQSIIHFTCLQSVIQSSQSKTSPGGGKKKKNEKKRKEKDFKTREKSICATLRSLFEGFYSVISCLCTRWQAATVRGRKQFRLNASSYKDTDPIISTMMLTSQQFFTSPLSANQNEVKHKSTCSIVTRCT